MELTDQFPIKCTRCAEEFDITYQQYRDARENGRGIQCPKGHVNHFGQLDVLEAEIERLKVSVGLLRLFLAIQMSGKAGKDMLDSLNREAFLSSLEELKRYEERLSAPDCQDIHLQFEAIKHLHSFRTIEV